MQLGRPEEAQGILELYPTCDPLPGSPTGFRAVLVGQAAALCLCRPAKAFFQGFRHVTADFVP